MHSAACCQKEKESRAALHFILRLKRKTLHRWKNYVSCLRTKKESQGHYKLPVSLSLFSFTSHVYLTACPHFKPFLIFIFVWFFFSRGSACPPPPPGDDVLESVEQRLASQTERGGPAASRGAFGRTEQSAQSTGALESLYPNPNIKQTYPQFPDQLQHHK